MSLLDLKKADLERIFALSDKLEQVVANRTKLDLLHDKIMASLFFQPSTRTRLSFESAMNRLGGSVIGFADAKVSRAGDAYAESIEDTARMINHYADVVAIRHFESGAAQKFADYAEVPVINAGDGSNEHPTQALLDLYTIKRERGKIGNMKVLFIGDMNQRTVHSLLYGLAKYDDVSAYLLHPDDLSLPTQVERNLKDFHIALETVNQAEQIIRDVDVVYVIFSKKSASEPPTDERYKITLRKLSNVQDSLLLMHPLPRMDELPVDVDKTRYGRYFLQPYYGVVVRMAILLLLFGRESQA